VKSVGWRDRRKNAASRPSKRLFERRDGSDPRGLVALARGYLEWMEMKNYSAVTRYHRERYLDRFIGWCELRSIARPTEVTRPILERYQRSLFLYRKPDGEPLSFQSQHERLVALRGFFKWLVRQSHILYNPASDLDLPKLEMRLPRAVLTESEAELVLGQPDLDDPQGVRDRALLETVYSTGVRRSELAALRRYDLDHERGTLLVRQGKGRKDRVIPIGERALHWVDRYLVEVRPRLVVEPDEGVLFLTSHGDPFTPEGMTDAVRKYVKASGVNKPGACHLFRHTMATVMHENGADIRFIQQMLGHSKLTTTEIYTQVSVRKLKEVHRLTHPTGRLEPEPSPPPAASVDPPATREELFATLDAEACEEDDGGDTSGSAE